MQVRQLKEWLVHVEAETAEDVSSVYRMPRVTEVVRHNQDGTVFTQLRVTRTPFVCPFFDLNFMRITYRLCHVWFTKVEYHGRVSIACAEYPIPIDEMQFALEQVNYRVW